MECPRCMARISDEWQYCPRCGSAVRRDVGASDDIFSRLRKEVAEFDKFFEKDFGFVNIRPDTGFKPQSRGFSIKIVNKPGAAPKVSIQTFGDVDAETIRKRVEGSLGVKGTVTPRQQKQFNMPDIPKETKQALHPSHETEHAVQEAEYGRKRQEEMVQEEPEAKVSNLGDRLVVEIPLPDVQDRKDIDIKDLESSIEVKAIAKDKVYFKILNKPEGFRMASARLDKGRLILELS